MPKFRFKLDPVLRARRIEEREKQRAVAEIERERREYEDRLRQMQQHITAGKGELRGRLTGRIDPAALRQQAHNSLSLSRKAQRTVLELAGVHKRLDAARRELVEAMRRRRAVELLRDKRYEQWLAEQEKADTAMIDELAVNAAAREEEQS